MESFPNQNERDKFNEYKKKFGDFVEAHNSNHHTEELLKLIQDKAISLRAKYGNEVYANAWYHMFIGSTPSQVESPVYTDFPGEDSVASFIDSLQK